MERLTSLSQIRVGSRLKIVGRSEKDSYGSISVKKIIKCETPDDQWFEILINRTKNYYFHFGMYLAGQSWAKDVFVLDGIDRRLKKKGKR